VALRTRKDLAEPIVSGPNRNAVVRPEGTGSPKYTKLQPTDADLPDQPLPPPQHRCKAILTVEWHKRGPAICGGYESREELQTKLIRGTSLYRNSHTLFEKQT
jgi:hypothetical protein